MRAILILAIVLATATAISWSNENANSKRDWLGRERPGASTSAPMGDYIDEYLTGPVRNMFHRNSGSGSGSGVGGWFSRDNDYDSSYGGSRLGNWMNRDDSSYNSPSATSRLGSYFTGGRRDNDYDSNYGSSYNTPGIGARLGNYFSGRHDSDYDSNYGSSYGTPGVASRLGSYFTGGRRDNDYDSSYGSSIGSRVGSWMGRDSDDSYGMRSAAGSGIGSRLGNYFTGGRDSHDNAENDWSRRLRNGQVTNTFSPLIDVAETADRYQIFVELPNVKSGDVNIDINKNIVTLFGKKAIETTVANSNEVTFIREERPFGSFKRIVTLDYDVDATKAKADMKNGVLTIDIPKLASSKRLSVKE